jgi:hypothetical protein
LTVDHLDLAEFLVGVNGPIYAKKLVLGILFSLKNFGVELGSKIRDVKVYFGLDRVLNLCVCNQVLLQLHLLNI